MKPWAYLLIIVALIGASAAVTHFLVDVGTTKCEATHATEAVAAATHEIHQAATVAVSDSSNAGHLAAAKTNLTSTTTDLRIAIHEPEPRTPAPGAATRMPNPFPAGFGLCWDAASSGAVAAVAACQARRGDADALPAGGGGH